jgi:hypothetical protein
MSVIILQRFANREYRLTQQDIFAGGKKAGDKYAEKQAEKYAIAVRDTYVLQQEIQQGEAASISEGRLERRNFGEVDARLGIRALDIIDEFQQIAATKKNKGGWGFQPNPTKFTRNARHRLLEAGAVIDKEFGLNCYEVTVTLPGSGHRAYRTLANWSGWLINRLLREVSRNTQTSHWFYVWELQKRGALHLHFAIAARDISDAKRVAEKLEFDWFELLLELEEKTDVELFRRDPRTTWRNRPEKWQSHVAPITKSCAAYFSKYAGKSAFSQSANDKRYCPSRWWGSSSAVKKSIESERRKWKFEASASCAREIKSILQDFLLEKQPIKTYSYDFNLGQTKNGTNLGGGEVWIKYYETEDFKKLHFLEEYYLFKVQEILRRHGYADMDTQTWKDADMACLHPYDADIEKRRHHLSNADMQTYRPSLTPSYPANSLSRKLSKSRGTQPKATLELRVRLIQFLSGGGEALAPVATPTEYWQGELFCKELYSRH